MLHMTNQHDPSALAALETRLVERMADLEVRIMRDITTNNWRTVGVVAVIASLLFAALRYLPPPA